MSASFESRDMKCISLWQPWATLIAIGAKKIETRGWETKYRGPIAIHAAKLRTRNLGLLCTTSPFWSALMPVMIEPTRWAYQHRLPFGAVVCTAVLTDCRRCDPTSIPLDLTELAFGDFTTGRFMWDLDQITPLKTPVPFKGQQGLFEVPNELLKSAT